MQNFTRINEVTVAGPGAHVLGLKAVPSLTIRTTLLW